MPLEAAAPGGLFRLIFHAASRDQVQILITSVAFLKQCVAVFDWAWRNGTAKDALGRSLF